MTAVAWGQLTLFSALVLLTTKPIGIYMARVFEGERRPLPRFLGPLERFLFRLSGVDPAAEQTWVRYTGSVLAFSVFSLLVTYAILRLQHLLPFNPQKLAAVDVGPPDPEEDGGGDDEDDVEHGWRAPPGQWTEHTPCRHEEGHGSSCRSGRVRPRACSSQCSEWSRLHAARRTRCAPNPSVKSRGSRSSGTVDASVKAPEKVLAQSSLSSVVVAHPGGGDSRHARFRRGRAHGTQGALARPTVSGVSSDTAPHPGAGS